MQLTSRTICKMYKQIQRHHAGKHVESPKTPKCGSEIFPRMMTMQQDFAETWTSPQITKEGGFSADGFFKMLEGMSSDYVKMKMFEYRKDDLSGLVRDKGRFRSLIEKSGDQRIKLFIELTEGLDREVRQEYLIDLFQNDAFGELISDLD